MSINIFKLCAPITNHITDIGKSPVHADCFNIAYLPELTHLVPHVVAHHGEALRQHRAFEVLCQRQSRVMLRYRGAEGAEF